MRHRLGRILLSRLIRGFQSVSRFSTRMQIMVLTWCACIEMEMICWWNTVSRQERGGSMKHLIRFASIALACGLLVCLAGCSCSSTQRGAKAGSRGNRRGNHDRPRWRLGHVRGIQPAGRAGRERDHGVFLDVGDRGFDAGASTPRNPSAPKRRIRPRTRTA